MKLMAEFLGLKEKINSKKAKIAVVGLGYVGLPYALHYSEQGFSVLGIDIAKEKIRKLQKGQSYIDNISNQQIETFNLHNQLSTDFQKIDRMDVVLINVPTPIDNFNQPDMSFVQAACQQVVARAQVGQLIILQSTSYPTTTKQYLVEPLEKAGWKIGKDIFVAFSPERVDPGNRNYTVDNTPKLIGGYTPKCTQLAKVFFGEKAVPVSSMEVAELAKLYENTFRYVNISFVDEVAKICDTLNIDVFEVIEAAGTKPFGFMKFTPSVKVGGHCIGVDPHYLKWFMEGQKYQTPIIDAAVAVDESMNDFTVSQVIKLLAQEHIPSFSANVAVLGVTYKKNISDLRESAAPKLVKELRDYGVNVSLYDPYVNSIEIDGHPEKVANIDYQELYQKDLILILTDHDQVDYQKLIDQNLLIFDTKGVTKNHHLPQLYGI